MRKNLLFFVAAIAMAMAACSPFTLKSSGALNGSDMSSYKSFSMQKINPDSLPSGVSDTDLSRLYRALGGELTKRGYSYVEGEGADFTIYVGLSTKQSLETDVNTTGFAGGIGMYGGYGPGPRPGYGGFNYYGPTPYTSSYFGSSTATTEVVTDGVMIVDLVENSSKNHIYYSKISANIDGERLILKDNEELAKVASKVFKKFPVKPIKK